MIWLPSEAKEKLRAVHAKLSDLLGMPTGQASDQFIGAIAAIRASVEFVCVSKRVSTLSRENK